MDKVFKNWKVERCIGEGAFGKVYEIVREEYGHTYKAALKVIEIPQQQSELDSARNDGMTEDNVTQYFYGIVEDIVEEFALMSKLKGNSNIVSYEDHSVVKKKNGFGWIIYIRMELLIPLYKHIKEKKMTIRDLIQLGIDICHALEICQKYNIIHRDIKPENIFISDVGTYKLGDFGIARELEKTSSGLSKKGTKSYMAPEVYKGLEYNSTVDIYSLGIVLYRFLNNNRLPFMPVAPTPIKYSDKEKADIMRMSGQAMPKPCNAEGRLAEIVLKACEYNPKDRYDSAKAMREALEEILYSEKEKSLVYPAGDVLNNSNEEYVSEISKKVGLSQENITQEDIKGEGTRYLFRSQELHSEIEQNEKKSETDKEAPVVQEKKEEEKKSIPNESVRLNNKKIKKTNKSRRKIYGIAGILAIVLIACSVFYFFKNKEAVSDFDEQAATTQEQENIVITVDPSLVETEEQLTKVPNFVGITRSEADRQALEYKLKVIYQEKYSNTVKKDVVISQNMVADSEVLMETEISLVLSKGVQRIVFPDITGKSIDKAKSILKKKGIKYSTQKIYSNSVKTGRIVYQSIKAGKKVKKGTKVVLKVSKGAKPVVTKAPFSYVPVPKSNTPQKPSVTKKPASNPKSNKDDAVLPEFEDDATL